jgi:hypothetical protein
MSLQGALLDDLRRLEYHRESLAWPAMRIVVSAIANDGGLSVAASSDSRTQAQPFRECYWKSVAELAEKRRAAGLAVPEDFHTHPV